ncbi:MAG: CtsR family transcriptional regulator [bacterium]|jgi:transcriptional regulator CtsR
MWSLADEMERWIKSLLEEADESFIELRRSELANHFSCVPSQVTYVLATRFVPERGYRVVSRRGAGGFIRIERLVDDKVLSELAELVGTTLTAKEAARIINNLYQADLINRQAAQLIIALLSDEALGLSRPIIGRVRANMLRVLLENI